MSDSNPQSFDRYDDIACPCCQGCGGDGMKYAPGMGEWVQYADASQSLHDANARAEAAETALATARAEAAAAKRELAGLRAQMAYDFAAVIDSWAAQLDAGVPHVAAEMERFAARVNRRYYGHSDPSDNPPAALLASPEARDAGEGGEAANADPSK